MHRRIVFMKTRVERDLQDMDKEPSQHAHLIERTFLGVDIGNHNAFVNFQLSMNCGPFTGCRVNVIIKIDADYPYTPPVVYCHDSGFIHPNLDLCSKQLMFSMVDPQYWKPTFELRQVVCGIEMILLTPELSYSSPRSNAMFNHAIESGSLFGNLGRRMDIEKGTLLNVNHEESEDVVNSRFRLPEGCNLFREHGLGDINRNCRSRIKTF